MQESIFHESSWVVMNASTGKPVSKPKKIDFWLNFEPGFVNKA